MKQTVQYQNGYSLSYSENGNPNGYPVLIQHGLIASIEDSHLFERLVRCGARLICPARPGYGESSPYLLRNFAEWAEILEVLLDVLEIAQFDVLGISSGAPYSYAIGARLPQKVRNIYIFSGIPALCDERVRPLWPYPAIQNAGMAELETLAHELFFAHLSKEDLQKKDIQDSMSNRCFGVAQDLRLRFADWGFGLSEVKAKVILEHSQDDADVPFGAAALTARLLPQCQFIVRKTGGHFSQETLDHFITSVIEPSIRRR